MEVRHAQVLLAAPCAPAFLAGTILVIFGFVWRILFASVLILCDSAFVFDALALCA